MTKTEKFATLIKEDGDVHLWQNTEELIKGSSPMGALSMLKLDVFLKDNISTYTVSFDNGKIDVKQKYYVSAELTDVLKKYTEGGMNTDMVKNIPSQNLAGILTVHFKPEGISEIVKLTGMDGFLNMFLSKENLTIDDFVKAIKGDVMFAVTDFTMKRDSFNFYNKPDANFLFSVSIGDKPSFDKLMLAGKTLGGQVNALEAIHSATNDKLFATGNSQQYVSKYIQGNNTKFDFTDKIANHPFFAFADIQKILLTASSQVKDSGYKIITDESIKTWQSFYSMGGEYKDGGFVSNTEIDLVDKNTNSLKQLNSYFDRIAKVMIEKNKENMTDRAMADSLTMDMPMDTSSIAH